MNKIKPFCIVKADWTESEQSFTPFVTPIIWNEKVTSLSFKRLIIHRDVNPTLATFGLFLPWFFNSRQKCLQMSGCDVSDLTGWHFRYVTSHHVHLKKQIKNKMLNDQLSQRAAAAAVTGTRSMPIPVTASIPIHSQSMSDWLSLSIVFQIFLQLFLHDVLRVCEFVFPVLFDTSSSFCPVTSFTLKAIKPH